ncbi:proline-rich protein 2-like [Lepus europaeus]|uniref:proline-rich protein 2-like n=1 Tax=Lepus europaeus TaxID=9983 RepID=UPI002B4A264B|nr:proline-rich protein 2-like [Lepus europaeus]
MPTALAGHGLKRVGADRDPGQQGAPFANPRGAERTPSGHAAVSSAGTGQGAASLEPALGCAPLSRGSSLRPRTDTADRCPAAPASASPQPGRPGTASQQHRARTAPRGSALPARGAPAEGALLPVSCGPPDEGQVLRPRGTASAPSQGPGAGSAAGPNATSRRNPQARPGHSSRRQRLARPRRGGQTQDAAGGPRPRPTRGGAPRPRPTRGDAPRPRPARDPGPPAGAPRPRPARDPGPPAGAPRRRPARDPGPPAETRPDPGPPATPAHPRRRAPTPAHPRERQARPQRPAARAARLTGAGPAAAGGHLAPARRPAPGRATSLGGGPGTHRDPGPLRSTPLRRTNRRGTAETPPAATFSGRPAPPPGPKRRSQSEAAPL